MYCPSCGNEITAELKYCNRCGANLAFSPGNLPAPIVVPVKLTMPTIVLGLIITIGLGIVFSSATEMARMNVHPAAITWMVIFSMAALFGCTALLLRFWSKIVMMQRQAPVTQQAIRPPAEKFVPHQLPPRFEQVPSVTEHTTRTFTPVYREPSERS